MGDQESSDEEQVDGIRGIIAQMLPFFCPGSFFACLLEGKTPALPVDSFGGTIMVNNVWGHNNGE